jgi:hypothetical protein
MFGGVGVGLIGAAVFGKAFGTVTLINRYEIRYRYLNVLYDKDFSNCSVARLRLFLSQIQWKGVLQLVEQFTRCSSTPHAVMSSRRRTASYSSQ